MNNNNKPPIISVVMSVYKEPEEWLRESIESILNQTFSDFEFIIVNDNPERKENAMLLKEYQKHDNRIVIITNEQNIGLTKSLNKGLKIANGKYIARMDADDISMPKRFEKQVKVMEENPKIIVCGSKIKVFGENKYFYRLSTPEKSDEIKALLIRQNTIAHSTVLIRKEILTTNNILYDEKYLYSQDYKLWMELCDFGDFHNVREILLMYRTSKSHISHRVRKHQNYFMALSRKAYVDKLLKEIDGKTVVDYDNITTLTLKEIKKYNVSHGMLELFYLSLKNYGFKELLYFIFSFDYMLFSLKNNLLIIRRFFQKRENRTKYL